MTERNERPQATRRQTFAARLDTIAQTLFSAGLIADVLQRIWERDPQEGIARLAELCRLGRGALSDLRELMAELHSAGLEDAAPDQVLKKKKP